MNTFTNRSALLALFQTHIYRMRNLLSANSCIRIIPMSLMLVLFLVSGLQAQIPDSVRATITGRITDAETGKPLPGANILIEGTFLGTAADDNGRYILRGLQPGTYNLRITVIGYQTYQDTVNVASGETREMNIELYPTVVRSPRLVVTGAKRSLRIQESPVSVDAISEDELNLRMPSSLNETLAYQSGVQMIGGDINIRGSSGYTRGAGSRVLMLVDGLPLLSADSDAIYWDAVPIRNIQRVEILKGPGSALYGSNALGGVVNVITAPISQNQTSVHAEVGRYEQPSFDPWHWHEEPLYTRKVHIQHEHRYDQSALRVGIGHRQSPGYYQNGWYKKWSLNGKFFYQPSSNVRFVSRLFAVDDTHGDVTQWRNAKYAFHAPEESVGDYLHSRKFQWSFIHSNVVSDKLAHNWRTIYYYSGYENSDQKNQTFSQGYQVSTEWQTDYSWNNRNLLTGGVSASFQGVLANLWNNHLGFDLATYLQHEMKLGTRTTITSGLRLDHTQFKSSQSYLQVNPKLGINFRLTDRWSLRSSIGRGYRAPSIAERYADARVYVFEVKPNPGLNAETSLSGEVGTHYEISSRFGFSLDMALFSSYYRNLIDPVQDPEDGKIHFKNITDARIQGFDGSVEFRIPFLPILQSVGYTYLEPRDLTADTVLAYRHRHSLISKTKLVLGRNTFLTAEYKYRSKIERVQLFPYNPRTGADRRVPVHLWNVHAYRHFGDHLTVRLSISNMLQYYYTTYERHMGEPRHIKLGVDLSI